MGLRVVTSTPQPRLTIAKPQRLPKITIGYNYGGLQGSTYNPQRAAGVKYVQNAASSKHIQQTISGSSLQGGYSHYVQPAATAAQVEAARRRAQAKLAAAIRQREALKRARLAAARRRKIQGELDSKIKSLESALELKVGAIKNLPKLQLGSNYAPLKISMPKLSDNEKFYNQIYEESKRDAQRYVDNINKSSARGTDKLFDWMYSPFRENRARSWAQSQKAYISDHEIKIFQKKQSEFQKLEAKLHADFSAKQAYLSKRDVNALAAKYEKQLEVKQRELIRLAAYIDGSRAGYGIKASEPMHSVLGRTASFVNRNVIQKTLDNPIWKYTLGGGSKNVPSLVTAPSRLINLIGNLNTPDRKIYKYGGKTENRLKAKENAWQATFNQRNFNIKPVIDKPYNKEVVWAQLKSGKGDGTMVMSQYAWEFQHAKSDAEKNSIAHEYWDARNRAARNQNSAKEFVADPLFLLSFAKIGKAAGLLDKVGNAGRAAKPTAWAFKGFDKAANTKKYFTAKLADHPAVKLLTSPAKTREEKFADAVQLAKGQQDEFQKKILPRIKQIDRKISGGALDTSVFDDIAGLTDHEAKIIQRMIGGKLSRRDRLLLAGRNNAPVRDKLEQIAQKWNTFSERMRQADKVWKTSYGGKARTYSPRTVWARGDLEKYNFRKRSKGSIQSSADFNQGAIDRYFKSGLDDVVDSGRLRLRDERRALLSQYDESMNAARSGVEKAYKKLPWYRKNEHKNGLLAKFARAGVDNTPMKLWKKSVLKYRPAWTINNVLYNTQAGVLAGGAGSLAEQARMLRPKYWRKAMQESRAAFGSDISHEIGSRGRLNHFYSGVEDWSRVAAGRAAMRKGLSEQQALKRVNKYLYDYSTKNWERPLKAVLPFWAWQKNLTKAAAQMPFDRPAASIAYNRLDHYQQNQFNSEFDKLVPKLKKFGYSDGEIEQIRKEQAKYYAGRLKIGGKYYTTPFNAFSEKGLSGIGFNPYLAAAGEAAGAVDSYGQPVAGKDASFWSRLRTKFPQAELGYKLYKGWRVDKGLDKPHDLYIGKPGSEGFGMTKEKQGYDPRKPNYVPSMDPRRKNKQDFAAFVGVPRGLTFDSGKLLNAKKLQKVVAEYFSKSDDWKDMSYPEAEKQRTALFKKYGMTADEFYNGVLAKYDTDFTKSIKAQKSAAAAKNKALFDEYAKQPKGTRNMWATEKLRELNAAGYFDDNPYLKGFKWINKESVASAHKQAAVQHALQTGDWSQYQKLVGKTPKQLAYEKAKASGDWSSYSVKYGVKSPKARAYQQAKKSGDWSAYHAKYGYTQEKHSPYQYDGKYFKSAKSMQRYKDGQFWAKYAKATPAGRRQLLADNPQYNLRSDWTDAQWDAWKSKQKAEQLKKLRAYGGGDSYAKYLLRNKNQAYRYKLAHQRGGHYKKVAYAS